MSEKSNEAVEKQQSNKREDKKALGKLLPMMLLALLIGALIGFASGFLGHMMESTVMESILTVLRYAAVYGGFVYTTGLAVVSAVLCRKSRMEYTAWDEEDEEVLNAIETKLSYAIWFSNLILYGSYFFFSVGVWATDIAGGWDGPEDIPVISLAAVFLHMIIALVVGSVIQQKTVNLAKEINPEKSGSVYDMKFNNKWLETCDEAEKYTAYKCAYKSFKVMNITGVVLWVVCLVGQMSFGTGAFATIIVTIFLLVMVSSYSVQAIYFAKHPSEVMK
ncbi:MAG: DUF3169 family protein [Lachnospiraceae bacterium]|nr:DUF3169 family protein [Lachnospiraceae bacterium]